MKLLPIHNTVRLIITTLLLLSTAQAGNVFVHNMGDDSGPGTKELPYRTITRALQDTCQSVLVAPGIYKEEELLFQGNCSDRIYIKRWGKGRVLIKGNHPNQSPNIDARAQGHQPATSTRDWGLKIENTSDVIVRDIDIEDMNGAGLAILDSNNIKVKFVKTRMTGSSGILANRVNDLVLEGFDVSRAVQRWSQESVTLTDVNDFRAFAFKVHDRPKGPGTIYPRGGEGFDVKGKSSNGEIFNFEIDGLDGERGIYIDGNKYSISKIYVYDGIVTNSGTAYSVGMECGTDLIQASDIWFFDLTAIGNKAGFLAAHNGGNQGCVDYWEENGINRPFEAHIQETYVLHSYFANNLDGIVINNPFAGVTARYNELDNIKRNVRIRHKPHENTTDPHPDLCVQDNMMTETARDDVHRCE